MKVGWLVLALAVTFWTYAPQLGSQFELQDDHRIIAPIVKPQAGALAMYFRELRSDFAVVGRFRPVSQIFDVIGPFVLGPRPFVWHVVLLLLATAVAGLLFHAAAGAFGSPAAGAAFALVTMLAPDPGPTAAWYRLGPKEAWAMLFLAFALVWMVARRSEIATFVFVALTAYAKESFLLLVPALFGVRVWLEMRADDLTIAAALRRLRAVAVAYGVLLAIGMSGLLLAVGSAGDQSYGGQSLAMTSADLVRVFARDALRAPTFAAWLVPFVLALFVKRPRLIAVLVFLAWIGPQYALHATRGGFWDHYWLPCVVAFAAMNAWAISVLRGRTRAVGLAVCAVWMLNAIRIDVMAVRNHKEKARVQQAAVQFAAEHLTPSRDLVVVTDDVSQGELAGAFINFLRARGGRFRNVLVQPSTASAIEGSVIVHLHEGAIPMRSGYEKRRVEGVREYLSLRRFQRTSVPFGIDIEWKRDG